ncbi:MAG: Pyridoxine/pyridoxamine 5'-phosphate oxidase [Bacteroidetes bacterium]|nr:Pyridoxine/pyridoxamine 5'-phosphate oxidase [Bacteroidota bacterium]
MLNIHDLRRDFTLKTLDEKELPDNPIEAFEQWFKEAIDAQVYEPSAMNLATVDASGRPSSRVVLLKELKDGGFVFFSNYDSRKGKQLASNRYCALNFVWHELERQVRIEGFAEKLSPEDSDKYFEVRPPKSKLGAWTSPQSEVIPDRIYLEKLYADFEEQFAGKSVPRPENWGGYLVHPELIEFWQGRSSRLHDRIQFRLENGIWTKERLAP